MHSSLEEHFMNEIPWLKKDDDDDDDVDDDDDDDGDDDDDDSNTFCLNRYLKARNHCLLCKTHCFQSMFRQSRHDICIFCHSTARYIHNQSHYYTSARGNLFPSHTCHYRNIRHP